MVIVFFDLIKKLHYHHKKKLIFNVGKISIGQKLTPDKIHQFCTKVIFTALQTGRNVSNTCNLDKLLDVGNKLLPMAETAANALGYRQEVLGFEGVRKGLDMVNTAKK